MHFEQKHFNFVSDIYACVMQESASDNAWLDLLDQFAVHTNAVGSHLIIMDPHRDFYRLQSSRFFDPKDVDYYNRTYQAYDADAYIKVKSLPGPTYYDDFDVYTDVTAEQFYSMPHMQFIVNHLGYYHRACACLNTDGRWMDSSVLSYSKEHGPITDAERLLGDALLPHLGKAVELNRTFMLLRSEYNAVMQALDGLNIGVFVTERSGRIVLKNREADRLLDLRDGLQLDASGNLSALSDDTARLMLNAVERTEQTASGYGRDSGFQLSIDRRSGHEPFLLSVSPLRDDKQEFDYAYRGAIVFAIDPENKTAISTNGLETLYNLSEAEAEVTAMLARGFSTRDIADQRSVSPQTVRSQIKSIFSKVGVNQRSDLVRLALSVNLPIWKNDNIPQMGDAGIGPV